jgi:hypothetical protein
MLPRHFRQKFFAKIAQTTTSNMPTAQVAATTPVLGAPNPFVPSDWYPSIITGFTTRNIPIINGLANVLNMAIFYSSNGQMSLPILRQRNWIFDASQVPNADLRNLLNYAKLFYQQILTNLGENYTQALAPEQIKEKVNALQNSIYLSQLSSAQPAGQLAMHVGGNVRELIKNYLLQIK